MSVGVRLSGEQIWWASGADADRLFARARARVRPGSLVDQELASGLTNFLLPLDGIDEPLRGQVRMLLLDVARSFVAEIDASQAHSSDDAGDRVVMAELVELLETGRHPRATQQNVRYRDTEPVRAFVRRLVEAAPGLRRDLDEQVRRFASVAPGSLMSAFSDRTADWFIRDTPADRQQVAAVLNVLSGALGGDEDVDGLVAVFLEDLPRQGYSGSAIADQLPANLRAALDRLRSG